MNILTANKFHYIYGGSERYFFELNRLLRKAGHQVIPFAMKHPENVPTKFEKFFVSKVNYWDDPDIKDKIKSAVRMLYSFESQNKIRQLIEISLPDIVHIHLIYHQISPSILPIIKDFNLPIVQTLHDYKPICPTYSLVAKGRICERCKGKRFYQAAIQRCNHDSFPASLLNTMEMYLHHIMGLYDIPDIYITPSNFMREKMIEFGMPSTKFVHIPNFVDPNEYEFSTTGRDYFVYLGRLVPIKGIRTLIDALSELNSGKAKLYIVGDGPDRKNLEKKVIDYGLENNIKFLGYQNGDHLKRILSGAKFTVLPSEVYENCPLAVLEAMAMGKPVIGSNIGGIPEIISNEEDGLLFQPSNNKDLASKIDLLLRNPNRVREMGRNARRKIEVKYNPALHYEKIMNVYHIAMEKVA